MGKRITRELLKKRAEHNDGDLATLQEVTLHQYDIEKIEGLEENCRDLEIVFLQNNQIGRIENVGKLKGLRYLQLALNNIRHIENLQHNEALEKLDLTVNFVENPLDLENLKDNYRLRELYLVGNPVNKLDGYRAFAIHTLPQLRVLDGVEITRTERLEAAQQYEALRAAYVETYKAPAAGGRHVPVEDMDASDAHTTASAETDTAAAATDPQAFQSEVVPHTPSARLKVARDLEALRQRDAAREPTIKPLEKPTVNRDLVFGADGRVRQKNEGKWAFTLRDTPQLLVLDLAISRFLDTSLLDVDLQPTYVRILIKGKLFQLALDTRVVPEQSLCERSTLTGALQLSMRKAPSQPVAATDATDAVDAVDAADAAPEAGSAVDTAELTREARKQQGGAILSQADRQAAAKAALQAATSSSKYTSRRAQLTGTVDIRGIVASASVSAPTGASGSAAKPQTAPCAGESGVGGAMPIHNVKHMVDPVPVVVPDDFVDDPDVPPLC